jgi:tetratricopeptide (TPR) repeat protein
MNAPSLCSFFCLLGVAAPTIAFPYAQAFAQTQTTQPASQTLTQPSSPAAAAAQTPNSDAVRQYALKLYKDGKLVQAMPLFEQLCAEYPKDNQMWEGWGVTTLGYAQTLPDADSRKKMRAKGRSYLVKAKELGDNSNLLQSLLGMIPEDGGELNYSPQKDVNDIMQQAEADFSRGDYDKARDGYLRALVLEPNNYEAALFIGDVYFKQHENGSAGEWFSRAVEIDSNRETAYRYWGDALSAMGQNAEAREKYIQSIVAEPYNNRSLMGLNQWAQRTKVRLNWVRLQDKAKIVATDQGPKVAVDPSLHTEDALFKPWMAYCGRRLEWQKSKFKQQFSTDAPYRRTLNEEADALHLMVMALSQPDVDVSADPSLAALVKIDQAGFLEPFALLNRADKDIAQDYVPYRTAHRETIYRYFNEFIVPKLPLQVDDAIDAKPH